MARPTSAIISSKLFPYPARAMKCAMGKRYHHSNPRDLQTRRLQSKRGIAGPSARVIAELF
ncbi:hypothetical protein GCM10011517_00820 [Actibacterium pelagium]|uniref:Uncharacterized protein n=1 Tax=Actibacterium pelagium TaxID=2029103 RepID=A0A917AA28_9RHOB|nr:hypothetical protein GCM10011517_00820 [Actibacterium pelagium]